MMVLQEGVFNSPKWNICSFSVSDGMLEIVDDF